MKKCTQTFPSDLDSRLSKISSEEQEKFLTALQDYVMEEWIDTFTDRVRDFLDDDELCEENLIHLKEGGYAFPNEIFSRFDFDGEIDFVLTFRDEKSN